MKFINISVLNLQRLASLCLTFAAFAIVVSALIRFGKFEFLKFLKEDDHVKHQQIDLQGQNAKNVSNENVVGADESHPRQVELAFSSGVLRLPLGEVRFGFDGRFITRDYTPPSHINCSFDQGGQALFLIQSLLTEPPAGRARCWLAKTCLARLGKTHITLKTSKSPGLSRLYEYGLLLRKKTEYELVTAEQLWEFNRVDLLQPCNLWVKRNGQFKQQAPGPKSITLEIGRDISLTRQNIVEVRLKDDGILVQQFNPITGKTSVKALKTGKTLIQLVTLPGPQVQTLQISVINSSGRDANAKRKSGGLNLPFEPSVILSGWSRGDIGE